MTLRVLLDANVLVSGVVGLERAESTPGAILRAWQNGRFALITSEPLISEVQRTLDDRYFRRRLRPDQIASFIASLRIDATAVDLHEAVRGVATHPEDDLVLSAAASARAAYLVTGDAQLLRLQSFKGTIIVSPQTFLATLASRETT